MRYLLAAVLLALALAALPPWPTPCGTIGDNGAPWWVIAPGDNPQFLPCDATPAPPQPPAIEPTATRVPVPTPVYPVRAILVPVYR